MEKNIAIEDFSPLVETLAKALCVYKGIDPDFKTTGLGILAPPGVEYPLWKAWADEVKFILDSYEDYRIMEDIHIREKYDDGMNDDRI